MESEVPEGVAMSSSSILSSEEADLPRDSNGINELEHLSSEVSAHGLPEVQEAVRESEVEPMDIVQEKETREETHSENATFEAEHADFPSLQEAFVNESAHTVANGVHGTPEVVLDPSGSRDEPIDIVDEEIRGENCPDNASIASILGEKPKDLLDSQQSSTEETAQVLEREVQDTPEAVLENSECKAELMDIEGSKEESQLDDAAFASTLEKEIVDLLNLQMSCLTRSARASESEIQDTPKAVLDCSASRVEPTESVDEQETREETHSDSATVASTLERETEETGEETHSDSATVASTLERETEDLSSSFEPGKYSIQLQCESIAPGGVCTVTIVGTAHVLKASCEEVEACIRHVKPEVVFLELCSKRTDCLFPSKLKVPTFSNMLEAYRKKEMNVFGLLYSWYLAKVGEKLEVVPGSEFRIAYEEALKCGASVVLGDRPVEVTLKRTWGKLSLWHKTHFIVSALTGFFYLPSMDEIHALLEQSDELTRLLEELGKTYPTFTQTLVVERDLYMVARLRNVARRQSSIVAVVGLGHLSGIQKHWNEDINVEDLMTIPSANTTESRRWFWSKVALGVGGIIAGVALYRHR